MQLYNTLSAEERAQLIDEAGKQRLTLSFYAYAKISDPKQFRDELFIAWNALDALGRIYVAHEGINAQLSVPAKRFQEFKEFLDGIYFLKDVRLNIAIEQDLKSFLKLKVKVRDKIVADGLNDETFDVTNKGIHLKAQEFNNLLEDPNTIVVDFRNHYESEVGHFEGAITPDVETFRESLPIINEQLQDFKEDKNLLMYCTGGIRCEKASAYFKHQGFKNVYQLEGGIIEYTRQIKEEEIKSKFIGKNFVFDHRLGERITDDCKGTMENCCSTACLEITHLPLGEQVKLRRGLEVGNKVFRKGKSDSLLFKNSGDLPNKPLGKAETKNIRQKISIKKTLIGKAEHYYTKSKIAQFLIENNELSIGDKILISGPTTGEQELIITELFANGAPCETGKVGDQITFTIPFRIRLSDRLYKVLG